jgi:acetyl esterase/lipase
MRRAVLLAALGLFVFLPNFVRADDKPADPPAAPAAAAGYEVEAVKDVAYRTGPDADPVRHKLDLYLPKGAKDFPVMVFVHGGSWRSGNKNMYAKIGEVFARNGVGAVVINYRLSPAVKHPAHVEDAAKALAWTYANIAKYGGRPDRIFLSGHSAGGHLVALLATDERYLKAENLPTTVIHGVMALSGVYTITPSVTIFQRAFGTDEAVCKDASPLAHVHANCPPFLLLYAESDFTLLDVMAEQMGKALKAANCEVSVQKLLGRNHITIIAQAANQTDPATQAMLEFIGKHSELKKAEK